MKKGLFISIVVITFVITSCQPKLTDVNEHEPNDDETQRKEDLPEYNWILQLDQTIPVEKDGKIIDYTLIMNARKQGGSHAKGTYIGKIYVSCQLDASRLSNEAMHEDDSFYVVALNEDFSFEVIGYEAQKYAVYGLQEDETPIAPLLEYQYMALISPDFEVNGILPPIVIGAQDEEHSNEQKSDKITIPIQLLINEGQVQANISPFKIGKDFEGIITKVPIGDQSRFNDLNEKMDDLILQQFKDQQS